MSPEERRDQARNRFAAYLRHAAFGIGAGPLLDGLVEVRDAFTANRLDVIQGLLSEPWAWPEGLSGACLDYARREFRTFYTCDLPSRARARVEAWRAERNTP